MGEEEEEEEAFRGASGAEGKVDIRRWAERWTGLEGG